MGCGGGGEIWSDPLPSWGTAGWLADGLDVGCERGVRTAARIESDRKDGAAM